MPKGQKAYIPNKRRIEAALRRATRDDVEGAVERGDRSGMREAQDYESLVMPRVRQEEEAAVERGNRSSRYDAEDMEAGYRKGGMVKYADGGMVRGCKAAQSSGRGFKGNF